MDENVRPMDPKGLLRDLLSKIEPESSLPSLRKLSRVHGFTIRALTDAARALRDEGLIEFRKGSGIRLKLRDVPVRRKAFEVVAGRIAEQIGSANLRAGQVLEKVSSLSSRNRVGRVTVIEALRYLERKSLVYKLGKTWVAGPKPTNEPRRLSREMMRGKEEFVIAIAIPDEATWLSSSVGLTSKFWWNLEEEARKYGVKIMLVYTHEGPAHRVPPGTDVVGTAKIAELLKTLGKRCIGLVYIDRTNEPLEIDALFGVSSRHGVPLLWMDKSDRPAVVPRSKLFIRCRYSGDLLIETAVESLRLRGHTRAVYAYFAPDESWQHQRFLLLECLGTARGLQIIPVRGGASETTAQDWVVPLLESALKIRNATALIAPNDYSASKFINHLSKNGVRVPQDISLISFDNHHRIRLVPVSSIDPGFGNLGYCAFHALFGIIHIKRGPDGSITAQPYLEDRGSIAVLKTAER